MKPKQLAALLKNTLFLQLQSGTFEYQGNTYNRSTTPPELYNSALGLKLNYMARDFLSKAGPGGMATKWSKEAYEILSAEADFTDDRDLLNAIGVIRSGEPLRGPDGKQVMGADGRPVYLTWRQLYSKETIDSQIKYEQAGFTNRTARAKNFADNAAAAMLLATQGIPMGPERDAAAEAALNKFAQAEQLRLGRPLTSV